MISMNNYVITIARGFGSGGKSLGMRLADELGISCYENRILSLASKMTGKDTAELIEVDEKLRKGSWNSLIRKFAGRSESNEPTAILKKFESDEEIFQAQCEIIRNLDKTESCIIDGKCADFVLKDFDNVISLYVEAPRAYCLKRITKRMNVDEEEAASLIEKTDKYRAEYYKYYTHGNYWTNPVNYDMTFNMDRIGEDRAVELIKDYIEMKFGRQPDKITGKRNLYTFASEME